MIYVAPPDRHLSVDGHRLRVTRGPKENWARPSIDVLFRSAALHFGQSVIGIVLSGRLDDGTAGLWAVKQRGGVAIVQSPEQAEYPSMPRSALAHVPVDLALPVEAIGAEVARLTREGLPVEERPPPPARMVAETAIARGATTSPQEVLTMGELSPNTCPECHGALVRIEEGSISRFRCHTGHAYSEQTLLEEVDKAIDASLWNAVRAIEERVFILRNLAASAREAGRHADAAQLDVEVQAAERQASDVRASMAVP
jgi:two-component system chemotaxis response regulator CheB